jgi:hypothetical protein
MGSSFAYNAQETDANYLFAAGLIGTLVNTVADGGNLLLDIGPKADGTIPQVMVDRLRAIGAWLDINGEAIYGTRRWTPSKAGGVRFTKGRNGFVYATALGWPGKELRIDAPVPVEDGTRIALLGSDEQPLTYRREEFKLVVQMPAAEPAAATKSQHAFVVRIGKPLTASLSARTKTTTSRGKPRRYTTTGKLALPDGISPESGCRGTIAVKIRAGKRAVVNRKLKLKPDCSYRARGSVPRRKLSIAVRFSGNPVLQAAAAPNRT